MSVEINIDLFEKNAKIYNRKGLRRTYSSFVKHEGEYISQRPLGASSQFVLEVVIDKEFVVPFQKFLKRKKFQILGSKNYYHIGKMIEDYDEKKPQQESLKASMEAIKKDYDLMKKDSADFEEIENDDAKFYFLPYNDEITCLCDFIEEEKTSFVRYCKKNDITIVMNIISYTTNMLKGFLGFNFIDAESKEEDVVDFVSNMYVAVDFSQRMSVYAASMLLTGVTSESEDLEMVNCHILADNLKYTK